jgi:serine protease SohB
VLVKLAKKTEITMSITTTRTPYSPNLLGFHPENNDDSTTTTSYNNNSTDIIVASLKPSDTLRVLTKKQDWEDLPTAEPFKVQDITTNNGQGDDEEEEEGAETTSLLKSIFPTKWMSDLNSGNEIKKREKSDAAELDENELEIKGAGKAVVFCCCVLGFTSVLVAGTWLALGSDSTQRITGYALLSVAFILFVIPFLLCLMACCFSCVAVCSNLAESLAPVAGLDDDVNIDPQDPHQIPHKPKFVFRRMNDEFDLERKQHANLLKMTSAPLPKSTKKKLKEALKKRIEWSQSIANSKLKQLATNIERALEVSTTNTSTTTTTTTTGNNGSNTTATGVTAPTPLPTTFATTTTTTTADQNQPLLSNATTTTTTTMENNNNGAIATATATPTPISPKPSNTNTSNIPPPPPDPQAIIASFRRKCYVIEFESESLLSDEELITRLRDQVSLIIRVANPATDQVIVRVSSPGGLVTTYGSASSQLIRLKNAKIPLTCAIDNIAASGGYMMACVADTIIASPFSFVGSIGVVTYIPNFERITRDKLGVDVYRFTAGKHKRTVDIFGDVTEEDKRKLREELDDMHHAFKEHVRTFRGSKIKDMDTVATGEGWLSMQALELGLIDEIAVSDDVIGRFAKTHDILKIVDYKRRKPGFIEELTGGLDTSARAVKKLWSNGSNWFSSRGQRQQQQLHPPAAAMMPSSWSSSFTSRSSNRNNNSIGDEMNIV